MKFAKCKARRRKKKRVSGWWWVLFWLRWFHIYPSLSLQFQRCFIVSSFFFFHLSVGLILTRVKLYAFDNSGHFRKKEKKKKSFLKCLFVKHQISRPAPFLCLMGQLLCWCGRKYRTDTSCWALHWLQINVLLMFLPLLEFLLYFLWLCCSLYIHLLEKGYFFWKTYYSGFLVANFAFSVLFFCNAVYHITKTDFFFSLLLVFITSPKRLSALKLPFHIFLRASPSKSKLLLSSPLCCFVLFNSLFIFYSFYLFIRINTELKL